MPTSMTYFRKPCALTARKIIIGFGITYTPVGAGLLGFPTPIKCVDTYEFL